MQVLLPHTVAHANKYALCAARKDVRCLCMGFLQVLPSQISESKRKNGQNLLNHTIQSHLFVLFSICKHHPIAAFAAGADTCQQRATFSEGCQAHGYGSAVVMCVSLSRMLVCLLRAG
jgi:hypothetical protein